MSDGMGWSGEELVLSERFDNCLTLLERGERSEAILSRFPSSAAQLRPLLETVETFRELPHYGMPEAAGGMLLGKLLAQNAQFAQTEWNTSHNSTAATTQQQATLVNPRPDNLVRFNWFGRAIALSRPVAAVLAVLATAGVILAAGLIYNAVKPKNPDAPILGTIEEVQPDRIKVDGKEILIVPGTTKIENVPLKVGERVSIIVKTVNGQTQAEVIQPPAPERLTPGTAVSNLPTVTPAPAETLTPVPTATSPPTATATSTPIPTATPAPTLPPTPPPGTEVEIEGTVQQVTVNNNVTVVVIDNRQYVLAPEIAQAYGPRLVVGIFIKFKGRFDEGGKVIVINLTQINNEVIVVNPPKSGGDNNDQGKGNDNKGKDSPDDKDKGKGNDNKGNDNKGKDSPSDKNNGKGNDGKGKK